LKERENVSHILNLPLETRFWLDVGNFHLLHVEEAQRSWSPRAENGRNNALWHGNGVSSEEVDILKRRSALKKKINRGL